MEENFSFFKFEHTPHSSMMSHLMMLASELKDKSLNTMDTNEKFWYRDAAALVTEVMYRYDRLEIQKEFKENGTIRGMRIDSDR